MDDKQRLQLNKMIKANDVEDVTESIREKKHSMLIKADIEMMLSTKREYSRLAKSNPTQFNSILEKRCNFLFTNYTDIFNRLKKDELNLNIMSDFISVLKRIEDGDIDQHEGAYAIGKLLKDIYIDSALQRSANLDEKHVKGKKTDKRLPAKKLSWKEYKAMQGN
tara:strand:- start:2221 stop:2715 length:495 start_codon:yes stop_codon:yes gene_type:complete